MRINLYRRYIKRCLDIILSFLGIIVLSPVMLVTAFFVHIKLGDPVIFKQKRPGKNEKIFEMYKFRSMTDERDAKGKLLPDEVRLTGFGKKLRATSLDELPELFNILKGDMSVVGPRPLLVEYLPRYSAEQRHRHDVRPGLTGLAQIIFPFPIFTCSDMIAEGSTKLGKSILWFDMIFCMIIFRVSEFPIAQTTDNGLSHFFKISVFPKTGIPAIVLSISPSSIKPSIFHSGFPVFFSYSLLMRSISHFTSLPNPPAPIITIFFIIFIFIP